MIGVYDSGLGGVSVLRAIHALLPQHDLHYLADTAYFPYGPLPTATVRERALVCVGALIAHGAALAVVACNTASSAALEPLRAHYPIPIVGVEPGIKPAVAVTRTRRIGVLATGGTLQGERFSRLVQRYASDVQVQTVPAPALVEQVEAGRLATPDTHALLHEYLDPLIAAGVDTVVLGCTHFHFLSDTIRQILGESITLIDTSLPVARRTADLAQQIASGTGRVQFFTTGDPAQISVALEHMWAGATVQPLEDMPSIRC